MQSVATETIKTKLAELKKDNLVIPEAKKMKDVSSTLNEGEFTTYVPVKEEFDFKATMNSTMANLKDKESFKKGTEDLKNKANELTNNIPKGSENLFGIIGGVIAIINTFLLAVFSVKIPIFGDYSIGFFKGLGILADFSKEVKNIQAILLFSGILFIAFAGLLIYSSVIKNKNILLYSIIGNAIFLVIFYIILFVKLPGGEAGKYISVSFFKILLYLISLALAFVTYFTLNKAEQNQISLNNGDDRNEEGL
ncbi:MAG: type II toxin-antitoxin system HicB family antitoxin [Fusobacterium periodonticum]|nr:type II toxin-antitoxin system HicB family antitoxin [Fusobacterium periodonticum]